MEAQTLDSPQLERCTTSQDKPILIHDKTTYLDKLYVELDQERESAATAGREALSMILRLQGEKALLKMEASQYKRMAEEKMCHAQEALAVFEDISYEREMEIAALEFQLLAYQYRLLSMGVTDVGLSEVKFPENLLMNGTDTIKDEAWPHRRVFVPEANVSCSSSIQDIFEVPQNENRKTPESVMKENKKLTVEHNRLMKPDLVTKLPNQHQKDRLKYPEKNSGKKRSKVSDYNYSPEYKQLSRRIERLERARTQENVGSELDLLKEICVQIKTLQSEMKSLKAKKSIEPSLDPLQEAMLYFWL